MAAIDTRFHYERKKWNANDPNKYINILSEDVFKQMQTPRNKLVAITQQKNQKLLILK